MIRFGLGAAIILGLSACAPQMPEAGSIVTAQQPPEVAATSGNSGVDAFHESIAVFDSHLDTPALFHTPDYLFTARGSFAEDGTHVDLPRMNEGGLDGGFWVIFTRQGPLDEASYAAARTHGLMRQTAIREFAAKYHEEVALAFSADDVPGILADGKKVVFQSMENSYPLGTDVSLLEHFYIGGLRMIAPVHFATNQFADSATDINQPYDGLSPLGEELVREANRLGLVLDGSHAADSVVRDMMALSTTPIILSHTGATAIYDHPRNIGDELLLELAENGGVIQMNIFGGYLEQLVPSPERQAALEALAEEYGSYIMRSSSSPPPLSLPPQFSRPFALVLVSRCPFGHAIATPAFGLSTAKHIIHTVGPIYSSDSASRPVLQAAFNSSLKEVKGRPEVCDGDDKELDVCG
ncbi:MAG: membrane dipeptidase [Pseudomonadota bacterium]